MLTVITSTVPSQSKCHLFTFQPPWSVSVLVSYHLYWNDWLLIPQFLLSAAKFSVFFLFPLFLGQILSQVSSCIFLKIDEFLFLQDFKLQKCCKKLCLIFFVILFFFFFPHVVFWLWVTLSLSMPLLAVLWQHEFCTFVKRRTLHCWA